LTEHAARMDLASAYAALDPLSAKVGLVRVDTLPRDEATAPAPQGIALWSSTYARLLLWPCPSSDAATVEASARAGQRWFDEVLVEGERKSGGRPIDGYLVLALPEAPDKDAREDVRRLELSAQVCRKHLIWPSVPDDPDRESVPWQRVADVTVLGFPDTDVEAVPSGELYWPEIDTEALALWEELGAIGVSAAVSRDEKA
jgi:hypothetical protein